MRYQKMTQHNDSWKPMKEASEELEVTYSFIRRLADRGDIEVKEEITDRRNKLVNVEEIRKLLQGS